MPPRAGRGLCGRQMAESASWKDVVSLGRQWSRGISRLQPEAVRIAERGRVFNTVASSGRLARSRGIPNYCTVELRLTTPVPLIAPNMTFRDNDPDGSAQGTDGGRDAQDMVRAILRLGSTV